MNVLPRIVLIIILLAVAGAAYGLLPDRFSAPDEIVVDTESPEQTNNDAKEDATENEITFANETQTFLSQKELEERAHNTLDKTNLPLGNNKFVTEEAVAGEIFLCEALSGEESKTIARRTPALPWISEESWNATEKPTLPGNVIWPQAEFTAEVQDSKRILTGNGLPFGHATGAFDSTSGEIQTPHITEYTFSLTLPESPVYQDNPTCVSERVVGVMNTGALLSHGLTDAGKDAQAHEGLDSCDGHPDADGRYTYYGASSCIENHSTTTVLGWAIDGFPITGSVVNDKKLSSADLDVCHGITSEIMIDGKPTVTYHYVLTDDYPYGISCFRGQPQEMTFTQEQEKDSQ